MRRDLLINLARQREQRTARLVKPQRGDLTHARIGGCGSMTHADPSFPMSPVTGTPVV